MGDDRQLEYTGEKRCQCIPDDGVQNELMADPAEDKNSNKEVQYEVEYRETDIDMQKCIAYGRQETRQSGKAAWEQIAAFDEGIHTEGIQQAGGNNHSDVLDILLGKVHSVNFGSDRVLTHSGSFPDSSAFLIEAGQEDFTSFYLVPDHSDINADFYFKS